MCIVNAYNSRSCLYRTYKWEWREKIKKLHGYIWPVVWTVFFFFLFSNFHNKIYWIKAFYIQKAGFYFSLSSFLFNLSGKTSYKMNIKSMKAIFSIFPLIVVRKKIKKNELFLLSVPVAGMMQLCICCLQYNSVQNNYALWLLSISIRYFTHWYT